MPEPGPATRIGRYQLVSPIGAGGMGRVWVALDTGAPALRLVAIKTALGQGHGASNEFWAMLSDEASLASRISHPNVCATYELGYEAGIHFLVMDWSDGASLRDLLDAAPGGRVSHELAAFIGASVAAGLHAAHELTDDEGHPLGVVHRDVSPQNVLVSMRGHVRLADFGVAKARGQQHRPTETGEVKGKLSYMAPEQITSKVIDRRADVFALGCLLYEATLGVRPFHGADALATMYKILEQELTPPRQLDPQFPEALETVLVKALAKNPDARYATAEDLRAGLLDYVSSTRRHVADKHVAEQLGGALGEKLRDRNRAIFSSAEQLRRGETDPSRLDSPPPPAPTKTLTPEGGIERSVTVANNRRSRLRTIFTALAAALLVLMLLVFTDRWLGVRAPANATYPTAAAGPPTSRAPAVSSSPGEASASPTPIVETSAVSVAAPTPSAVGREPTRISSGSRGSGRIAPRPVASDLGAAPAVKAPGRKPRPLDRSNPFANP